MMRIRWTSPTMPTTTIGSSWAAPRRSPMSATPTTPRPRARRGEGDRLRTEILEAAEGLLMETASEDAVSIRAVAQAVGVSPPSIYRHFADKDMLLLEVCRHSFNRFAEAMDEA